jgi:hypothetical protein
MPTSIRVDMPASMRVDDASVNEVDDAYVNKVSDAYVNKVDNEVNSELGANRDRRPRSDEIKAWCGRKT